MKTAAEHMKKEKNKPHERMCVSCRLMKEKDALIRIVKKGPDAEIDPGKKGGGRGAYVCADPACFEKMIKKKLLNRSFGAAVSEASYQELREAYQRIYG